MSWMSQLYETYERNAGRDSLSGASMTPIAHMNANAQLEVTLSREGEFLGAVSVPKQQAATLIPVTEASAGRSSAAAPHALCDTLSYVAGDFEEYCGTGRKKNGPADRFGKYIEGLKAWAASDCSHPKIRAVCTYLSQKRLMSDLIRAGLVELDEDGRLSGKKIEGQPYEKALVRFRVLGGEAGTDGTWADSSLIRAYTAFYLKNQKGKKDICYFTGQERTISENHPKGIVAANYGAKLVSANDRRGYTYRGRFQDAGQACALSYEASQKIHSALTWLAKNQGAYIGTSDRRMFLCWNPKGKKVPEIFGGIELASDGDEDAETPAYYKRRLIKTLRGYRDGFGREDVIVVMGLDAATTGRLSVTYYNEVPALDFLDRIACWRETCSWYDLRFDEKGRPRFRIDTPPLKKIAECAFGRERNGQIEAEDKILKEHVQRLLKCMIEGQPVPFDIVQALTARASMPLAYSRRNRERLLSAACALISKYHNKKGDREDMKLNCENRDRSYLFGRLLAIYEKAERATYERGESREPNAIRLQSAYVHHPMQTWKILEDLLNPYFQKLPSGLSGYYKKLIGDVTALFQEESIEELNQGLKETYLLGYYLQRAELNNNKEMPEKEENENEQFAEQD